MGKFPIESAHFAIPSYGAHMLREIAILLRYSESMAIAMELKKRLFRKVKGTVTQQKIDLYVFDK